MAKTDCLEIKKVSRDVYQTKLNGTAVEWFRYDEYPKFPHVFSILIMLERVLNHDEVLYAERKFDLIAAIKGAHGAMAKKKKEALCLA